MPEVVEPLVDPASSPLAPQHGTQPMVTQGTRGKMGETPGLPDITQTKWRRRFAIAYPHPPSILYPSPVTRSGSWPSPPISLPPASLGPKYHLFLPSVGTHVPGMRARCVRNVRARG